MSGGSCIMMSSHTLSRRQCTLWLSTKYKQCLRPRSRFSSVLQHELLHSSNACTAADFEDTQGHELHSSGGEAVQNQSLHIIKGASQITKRN